MPVKKNVSQTPELEIKTDNKEKKCLCSLACGSCEFPKKLMMTFLGILLVYVIVFIGVLIRNEIKKYIYIGLSDKNQKMITINVDGSSVIKPDVARLVLGVTSEAITVEEAQSKNTETMNKFLEGLKNLGIANEDIQTTNYNVNPIYNWTENDGRTLDAYEVSQQVTVKIKDTAKTSEVLSLAGSIGITNIGNLEWIVDDRDHYTDLARADALEKAKKQITILSESLGVNFVDVISYNEYSDNSYPVYYAKTDSSMAYGLGGASTPTVSEGSEEVKLNVSITFEIK